MPDSTPDPNERIDIVHETLPGQVGSCFRFQLPVFEAGGWAEKPRDETPRTETVTRSGDVPVAVQDAKPTNPTQEV